MTYHTAHDPQCTEQQGSIQLVIEGRARDLGGFEVRRVLPSGKRRMVGPFIFFDHMGPAEFPAGEGIQVRPHPHIGLATVTYLFEGELMHRDSLGYVQAIQPRAVNLMTAGRGIVHSERAGSDLDSVARLHGIQSWMALPDDLEETEPSFAHYPADTLPEVQGDGVTTRVILGEWRGERSPVETASPSLYLECVVASGSQLTLDAQYSERAVYVVDGQLAIEDAALDVGGMAVLCPGVDVRMRAERDSRVMIIGGDPVGERHIWWNFVASSRDRIERAKAAWTNDELGSIPGETERIPLPDR